MQHENLPGYSRSTNVSEDPATRVILAKGGADDVPAFVLRHWRTGNGSREPAFVVWLLDIGRFCLTVKYDRYSLNRCDWRFDDGAGRKPASSPLDEAQTEALLVSQTLEGQLNHPVPVAPAVASFNMTNDRRIERLARQCRVPVLWDLANCNRKLARAAVAAGVRQPLTKHQALREVSALIERWTPAGTGLHRPATMDFQSASAS